MLVPAALLRLSHLACTCLETRIIQVRGTLSFVFCGADGCKHMPLLLACCCCCSCPPTALPLPSPLPRPGGWLFDPLNLAADPERYERMRVREIKNGRLAMVAWLGFAAQAAATRQGPAQNLLDALAQLRN